MSEKHYLHITGTALCEVTYNYEIVDLEKFKQEIQNKRGDLQDIHDLWDMGILGYKTEITKYINVDYESAIEDSSYTEVNGSSDEVESIIKETNLRQLDEWYN
jgi:hypothetical protein